MTSHERHRRGAGVVIAGGGLAAQRAAETLRRNGHDGTIQLISDEAVAPYDRPPLSKEYLARKIDDAALRFRADDWYRDRDVELLLGERAVGLDVAGRELTLASGSRLPFRQLLIATGSTPRRLPGIERFSNVHELRSLADARRLRDALRLGARLVMIGAGFIGQEVASTAHGLGVHVTVVEAARAPLAAVLGVELGAWFARLHRDEGIDVRLSARITQFHGRDAVEAIELDDGPRIECDLVVVGVGTVPATRWLVGSGLDDEGIPVDAAGRTAVPGIYAAGDAAKHFDSRLGAHTRTEHWEAAARQGAAAARSMLGLDAPPPATPSFWSDQHGLRIQYLGRAHGADDIRIDGDPRARDFTATFTDHGRPIGALLVGRPHALAAMRRQIDQATKPPGRKAA
jgi:3-phenylpropionate/trans-cinnamate dioxygenase ferredoxin reductase component